MSDDMSENSNSENEVVTVTELVDDVDARLEELETRADMLTQDKDRWRLWLIYILALAIIFNLAFLGMTTYQADAWKTPASGPNVRVTTHKEYLTLANRVVERAVRLADLLIDDVEKKKNRAKADDKKDGDTDDDADGPRNGDGLLGDEDVRTDDHEERVGSGDGTQGGSTTEDNGDGTQGDAFVGEPVAPQTDLGSDSDPVAADVGLGGSSTGLGSSGGEGSDPTKVDRPPDPAGGDRPADEPTGAKPNAPSSISQLTVGAIVLQVLFLVSIVTLLSLARGSVSAGTRSDAAALRDKIARTRKTAAEQVPPARWAVRRKALERELAELSAGLDTLPAVVPPSRLRVRLGLAFSIGCIAVALVPWGLKHIIDGALAVDVPFGALAAIACAFATASYGLLGRRETDETQFLEDVRALSQVLSVLPAPKPKATTPELNPRIDAS